MTPAVDVFEIECPLCHASIALPRQSPLGKYGGLTYQPTDKWPITFWCSAVGQLCAVAPPRSHPKTIAVPDHTQPWVALWEIECECAHENCGRHHTIYSRDYSSAPKTDIADALWRILGTSGTRIRCSSDHYLLLTPTKIRAQKLDF
jgi:hypothetical protein